MALSSNFIFPFLNFFYFKRSYWKWEYTQKVLIVITLRSTTTNGWFFNEERKREDLIINLSSYNLSLNKLVFSSLCSVSGNESVSLSSLISINKRYFRHFIHHHFLFFLNLTIIKVIIIIRNALQFFFS